MMSVVLLGYHVVSANTTVTVITTDDLKLHMDPDLTSTVLTVVPSGMILQATARDVSLTWVLVTYQGQTGWLYIPFLSHTAPLSTLPVTNASQNVPTTGVKGVVTATALYDMTIRGGPGRQYEALDVLFEGDSVVLDGISYNWVRFNYRGITKGWLRLDYLQIDGDLSTLPDVTYPPLP
jgi:uncharacterized protein YraI